MTDDALDLQTTKYLIHCKFVINGVAERSDVIGAVFGQTEGLIGEGLDLRELQKTSRIGRIVVKLQYDKSKRRTSGNIILPSSLDRVETAVLAASLETVDRVGPCIAKVQLTKVEDVRESKRQQIVNRASTILKSWEREVTPESVNLIDEVLRSARTSVIRKYGSEGLPAGPGIEESDSLIVVEGRADVLNLLRHGFRNCIAVEGTSIPKTVISLSEQRITTAFLDGDRGGDLILKELLEVADIDYVTRAPEGREVEELSGKEILKTLRNKVPIEQVLKELEIEEPISPRKVRAASQRSKVHEIPTEPALSEDEFEESLKIDTKASEDSWRSQEGLNQAAIPVDVQKIAKELEPREAILVDEKFNAMSRIPVSDLRITLQNTENVHGAVFDGVLTQRLIDVAQEQGLKFLAGAKLGELTKKPTDLSVYALGKS
ncbi:MAG: DNA primase DnaG [Candidatus Hodarchaeota archaeon]